MAFAVLGACTLLLAVVLRYGWKVFKAIWLEPHAIRKAFLGQGIPCLPYRLLIGNLKEIFQKGEEARAKPISDLASHSQLAPRIFPYYYEWKQRYGDHFVCWFGFKAAFCLSNPDHIKEILSNKFGHFKKSDMPAAMKDWTGDSIGTLEGKEWAKHRRIVGPAFFIEKLKGMAITMAACVDSMLTKWESQLDSSESKEIEMNEQFKILTADIIAHTAFGSSYESGKLVFELQKEQGELLQKILKTVFIPGFRYLPTYSNRRLKWLKSTIESTLADIVKSRGDDSSTDDLLGTLLAANRNELSGTRKNLSLDMQAIIDECKTFFFAGHETTATLMTWTIMLLAVNDEWQERARHEVLQFCNEKYPTYESVNNLKLVGMIINEALRLFPPAPGLMRETTKQMKLGDITIPANVLLFMPIIHFHHDPAFWGANAHEFNPQRFANGVVNACTNLSAYFPFSMGPRNCVGQNFALLEAKIILVMMLQRFRFSLSPHYVHVVMTAMTIQPKHGMQIIFEKLDKTKVEQPSRA